VNELFVALYLDEDVDVLLAKLLRSREYDVLTTRDAGQNRRSDPEQLAFAVSQGRAIVTHNRDDYAELARAYAEAGQQHFGIILAARRSPYAIAQRLLVILDQVTADEMQDQVRYI
jgi:predicted nuclease of predicted toxin-antitoxin system